MAYTIMLDPGHGGYNSGAIYNERKEKDDNLTLTLAVGELLESYGFQVLYTRETDIYESPFQKAQEGNSSGADLFVSIHRNSSPVPNTYSGIETLIYENGGVAEEFAKNINGQLEAVGFEDLGIKERPNLIVLNSTDIPSVLIEVGFLNTDIDNVLFDSEFDKIAYAIADGIAMTVYPENY